MITKIKRLRLSELIKMNKDELINHIRLLQLQILSLYKEFDNVKKLRKKHLVSLKHIRTHKCTGKSCKYCNSLDIIKKSEDLAKKIK